MNEIVPKEIITDGIGQIYYLLPIPFIFLVLGISIWLGFTRLDGTTLKGYKIYNIVSIISIAVLAHFFIPVDERIVNDIPTLIIAVVSSGLIIEIFVYWRKKKTKKK